jgi:hypothetical protein
VPYELSFTVPVTPADPGIYINDCCWGGDVIRDRLLPAVSSNYDRVRTFQEDWGWGIWFRDGLTRLSVDICCDDIANRKFRIRLTSCLARWFFFPTVIDTPELERLRELIVPEVTAWAGPPVVDRD